MSANSINR